MSIAIRTSKELPPAQLAQLSPKAQEMFATLLQKPLLLDDLDAGVPADLASAYAALQTLWGLNVIELVNDVADPDISIGPTTTGTPLPVPLRSSAKWRLSRFAYAHRLAEGPVCVETPRSRLRMKILRSRAASLLFELATPTDSEELQQRLDWIASADAAGSLLALFSAAELVDVCDANGSSAEDSRTDLMQWDFHDLLFHSRSRMGRHDYPMGADFRFKGKLEHEPVVSKARVHVGAIALHRPSAEEVTARDPPLMHVMEQRKSVRAHDNVHPISAEQLGEFLYRTARNRFYYQTEYGQFTSRPYPSGGGSYELEIYLTVNRCRGLERGFYYYDPEAHTVALLHEADDTTETMLRNAWVSSAQQCYPQILITIASRFHRVGWKYSGIAYATQLKDTGIVFQTFYLVATAMNLAPCGLGLGDSQLFCKLAKRNYFEEGSIGEFMLGTPA